MNGIILWRDDRAVAFAPEGRPAWAGGPPPWAEGARGERAAADPAGPDGGRPITGGDGDQTLRGTAGRDFLIGGDGDDTLFGRGGPDKLIGGDGNDTLDGGPGDDEIIGGAGADSLTGGSGDDLFRFDDVFGDDVINDFAAGGGEDRLDLSAFGIETLADADISANADGDAVITIAGAGTITLLGVAPGDLTDGDIFVG